MTVRVFGGAVGDAVTIDDVQEVIRLDNEIRERRRALRALAENVIRRLDGDGGRVGVHLIEVEYRRRGERRERVLMVDGAARWVRRA